MMLLCPYVCYLIAEGLELSGIVAILSDKTKQVQDLASTADSLYQFWGEA